MDKHGTVKPAKHERFPVPKPASSLQISSSASMQNGNGNGRSCPPRPPPPNANKGPPKSGMNKLTNSTTMKALTSGNSANNSSKPGVNSSLVTNLEASIYNVKSQLNDLHKMQEERIDNLTTRVNSLLEYQKSLIDQNKRLVAMVEKLNSVIVKMGDQMNELMEIGVVGSGQQQAEDKPVVVASTATPENVLVSEKSKMAEETTEASAPVPIPQLNFNFGTTTSQAAPASSSFRVFGIPPASSDAGFNFNLKTTGAGTTIHANQGTTPESARLSPNDTSNVASTERKDRSILVQPLIPLPPLVETKTGEEDEDVLWSMRSKLFRIRDKEWKEWAIGDMKILKHRETGKCRLMIRRGTDKIGLNQPIKPDLTLTLMKDEKSIIWGAVDFSDGHPTPDSFLLRVKKPSDAKEFITKVQELVKEAVSDDAPVKATVTVPDSTFTDGNASESTVEESDTDAEQENDNIQFKPLIPLPPLVQTKTGEEDEDVLWAMHSKLFRMRNREWKERALGEMKILKNRETGKCRLLIFRGQCKIGLNQPITPDLTPTLMKDDKSVTWGAVDFSDGEANPDTFLLRMKSTANAKEFIAKLLEVVQEAETSSTSSNVSRDDSDFDKNNKQDV